MLKLVIIKKIIRTEHSYTQTVTKATDLPTNNYDMVVSVNFVKNFTLHIFIIGRGWDGGGAQINQP